MIATSAPERPPEDDDMRLTSIFASKRGDHAKRMTSDASTSNASAAVRPVAVR
jgi:hypothetical protein